MILGTKELQRRIAEVERVASEARDMGNQALAEIAKHSGICSVRQQAVQDDLSELKGTTRWQLRGIIVILFTALGFVLLELAKAAHFFGK